jgi:hypothetical protein
MYPTRLDILQVLRQDIFMKVDLCTATGKTLVKVRAERHDKIIKNYASFHKWIRLVPDY